MRWGGKVSTTVRRCNDAVMAVQTLKAGYFMNPEPHGQKNPEGRPLGLDFRMAVAAGHACAVADGSGWSVFIRQAT